MVWNFKNLDVWDKAFNIIEDIYEVTEKFPSGENYNLTSQIRRAVVSISSNIAEGCGRRTSRDFISFLYIALGSTKEIESQLMVAGKLGFLSKENEKRLIDEVVRIGRMLMGLVKSIEEKDIK